MELQPMILCGGDRRGDGQLNPSDQPSTPTPRRGAATPANIYQGSQPPCYGHLKHLKMGILDTLRTENLAHNLAGKNVLVTGGTKGIGAGGTGWRYRNLTEVAYHFAELGANVAIAGRSTKEAELLLQRLRGVSPNPDAKFEFFYLDAQLNSNSIAFADQMREKYAVEGLYALAMSQDAIADGPRKDTVEGHEWYTILLHNSNI